MGLSKSIKLIPILALLLFVLLQHTAIASYTAKNLNVTLNLNKNGSAGVTEILNVQISNASVQQYSTDRLALNLTLSDWQEQIGPDLEQHIINPSSGTYNFKFFPGPVTQQYGISSAQLILTYNVSNVTSVNETAPRQFTYKFNSRVLNFEHGVSGEILSPNTTLTLELPQGGMITSIYPIPDLPTGLFTSNYNNVTKVSWLYGEPLSKFTFVFIVKEGLQSEVAGFLSNTYNTLGVWTYVIIALAIVLFIIYGYVKATK